MRICLSLLRQFVIWILIFALTRLVFLIYYYPSIKIEGVSFYELISIFWHALPVDISTASYILVLPFIILLVQSIFPIKWINYLNYIYTAIVLLTYLLITVTELGIYEEWKTKLSYKALHYLSNPSEVYNSASTKTFFVLILLLLFQFAVGFYFYKKYLYLPIQKHNRNILLSLIFGITIPGVLFLGIRGGFKEIPINQSKSYFSTHNILNLAAINSGYSFLKSSIDNFEFREKNPFNFLDQDEAIEIVDNLHKVEKDTTIYILNTKRPNIVLLILESWSADVIESISGDTGITPCFKQLEQDGILFTNIYVTGNRSDQAMVSIFGGFPATPIVSLSHNPDKISKLPSLIKILNKEGYNTSFYFGGQLIYGGIKSYLMVNGFDRIKEVYDFDKDLPRGKLGIHDEFILNEQLFDLKSESEPFLSTVFTLSSHSPYDQPKSETLNFADTENDFLNSVYYTDNCLCKYFEEARSQPWYRNTLFIIVADHSHGSHKNWSVLSKEYRRIPLLFMGDVVNEEFKGQKINRISSQNDIPATLLQQLELDNSEFYWSRDLFNPYSPEFAYFEATEGVGWVSHDGYFVYHRKLNDYFAIEILPGKEDKVLKEGKAYLQVVFQQFLDL